MAIWQGLRKSRGGNAFDSEKFDKKDFKTPLNHTRTASQPYQAMRTQNNTKQWVVCILLHHRHPYEESPSENFAIKSLIDISSLQSTFRWPQRQNTEFQNTSFNDFLKIFWIAQKGCITAFYLCIVKQNKEVWVSGWNQHTANRPNRKVPKVRNRQIWWGSSIGSEQLSTKHQVVGSSPTLITRYTLEIWQRWSIA